MAGQRHSIAVVHDDGLSYGPLRAPDQPCCAAEPCAGVRVLVDPWLVGDLTFGGLDWLYRGVKRVVRPEKLDIDQLAAQTDLILLTMVGPAWIGGACSLILRPQAAFHMAHGCVRLMMRSAHLTVAASLAYVPLQSIDDHAHRPTLRQLPRSLPVVGSASAAAVARELGYATVYELDHGQQLQLCGGKLTVTGTAGALVGPPWSKRELGFVLAEAAEGGARLYYEPHAGKRRRGREGQAAKEAGEGGRGRESKTVIEHHWEEAPPPDCWNKVAMTQWPPPPPQITCPSRWLEWATST